MIRLSRFRDSAAQGTPPPKIKPLTVVIPAYNVAPYIGECVLSVLQQPGCEQALDIIAVIDGATDDTLVQLQDAVRGFERNVQIVVQDNAGLSAARNTGLNLAATEYVTFLDGDDIWRPDYLATLLPLLSKENPDLIEYDAMLIGENGDSISLLKIADAETGTRHYIGPDDFIKTFRCYSWARIYRTDLVRRRLFPAGKRFEDVATTPWHYWHSTKSLSLGQPLIGYRQRPLSILKTPSVQDIKDLAETASDASRMYLDTGSRFWQLVAHRAFQQACRRTTWQPFSSWPENIATARKSIKGIPHPPGFARWLQTKCTLLYTALLLVKRKLQG